MPIAAHWLALCAGQAPHDSWQMLSRCSEVILKVRRAEKGSKGESGEAMIEEFRRFMGEVLGDDG